VIIQSAADWPAGWAKLLRILANCRRFTAGASDVINDVANGEVMAGLAIDYYAYMEIAARGENLGFALVAGSTAFTPDPVALLKGAPHEDLGRQFIEFVLSPRGQGLFCLPPGAPDGPVKYALYRQPIRRDAYEKWGGKMLAPLVNPFAQGGEVKYDAEAADVRVSLLLGPLMKAAVLDSRQQLADAWKAVIAAGSPEPLVRDFAALPADLADQKTALETARKLADYEQREIITSAWQRYFRNKYNSIIAKAGTSRR
jgi:spermidine/putrescine-binding protein